MQSAQETGQREVVAFLANPATHRIDQPVEVVTTHSAHVFLAGEYAYKIKRAVKFNYLDFTALATRKRIIEHELELNAPGAPTVYDRVVAITRAPDGGLELDGPGTPVEYALKMNRFARAAELSVIADAGELTIGLAEKLGASVAGFHAAAPWREEDGAQLIREILDELDEAFHGMEPVLGADALAEYRASAEAAFAAVAPLLSARSARGTVRRCHGDLHLKNMVMIEGRPVPFDALEFDERLGTCDVFYDFAFLVMDLLHRRLAPQANAAMNAYLAGEDDFSGLTALPLYLGVRAAIRAMVAVQTMSGEVADRNASDARTYLADATRFLTPPPPRLVAIGGLSGTGKTTLAHHLAPGLGPVPGALHLRSDLLRKAHFGVGPLERLPDSAYSPVANRAVYDTMLARAEAALAAGQAVLLDATFLAEADRAGVEALAKRAAVRFDGIWLTAPASVLEGRVNARTAEGRDPSDADIRVVNLQLTRDPGPMDWMQEEAGGPAGALAERLAARLISPV